MITLTKDETYTCNNCGTQMIANGEFNTVVRTPRLPDETFCRIRCAREAIVKEKQKKS